VKCLNKPRTETSAAEETEILAVEEFEVTVSSFKEVNTHVTLAVTGWNGLLRTVISGSTS
jgi:hypothetical protein